MRSLVTRGCQITLGKDIREDLNIDVGTPVTVNKMGSMIIIQKIDEKVWDKAGDFLPENFDSVLRKIRTDETSRLKKLGVLPI